MLLKKKQSRCTDGVNLPHGFTDSKQEMCLARRHRTHIFTPGEFTCKTDYKWKCTRPLGTVQRLPHNQMWMTFDVKKSAIFTRQIGVLSPYTHQWQKSCLLLSPPKRVRDTHPDFRDEVYLSLKGTPRGWSKTTCWGNLGTFLSVQQPGGDLTRAAPDSLPLFNNLMTFELHCNPRLMSEISRLQPRTCQPL